MTPKTSIRRYIALSDLMLLLVAVVWGSSYVAAKQVLQIYPVLGILALRFGISFVLLSPSLRAIRGAEKRDVFHAIGTGLLMLAILTAELSGVMLTTAANAAFLISLCVGFTPVVEWIVLKRRPTLPVWLAVAVSILGAAMLTGGGPLRPNMGDGLIVLAAVLRAVNVCVTKRTMQGTRLSSLSVTALQSGTVTAGSVLIATIMAPHALPALPAFFTHIGFWGGVAYLSVMCTLFAFFAQNYALKRSSPTRASLLMGSEPAFGAVFAALLLGESISAIGWFGGGLIVVASMMSTMALSEAPVLSEALLES